MELSSLQIIGIAILAVIGMYIVARLITKATFKSYFEAKGEFEKPTDKKGGK
jgi:hypothetical protein